jgi:hypothetical protein
MTEVNPIVEGATHDHVALGPRWRSVFRLRCERLALTALGGDASNAVRAASRTGALAHASKLVGPSRDSVLSVFPWLSRERAADVAKRSSALRFTNHASLAIVRQRGVPALARLADAAPADVLALLERRSAGIILIAWHVGAEFGISAALHRWNVPSLAMPHWYLPDTNARARVLAQAVEYLRGGGIVLAAVDGPGGASTRPVSCLGRRIVLRRGAFMLARVTNASIVPAVARWTTGGRIETTFGDPLTVVEGGDENACEHTLAQAAAGWLEDYLTRRPEEIWPYLLRSFEQAPREASAREERSVQQ